MTRKQIMSLAWAIKATNKENLFSECLKLAWQVSREDDPIKALELLGFNRWTKTTDSGKTIDRLYINAESLGVEYDDVHGRCTLDGEHLSNNRGRSFRAAKTYYDLSEKKLYHTVGSEGEELGRRAKALVNAILN